MCMGAAISFFVGEIVYSMDAPDDGGSRIAKLEFGGPSIPQYKMAKLTKGILVEETKGLIREYITVGKNGALVEFSKQLLVQGEQ